jgi:hypothetical protein
MKPGPSSFLHVVSIVVGILFTVVALPARAQVAGSITGMVIDQTGNPLSGVKISARSETQIGGTKVTYSGADGTFRLPSLATGTFEVRASAPKMQEVLQRDVKVGITSATDITIMMEVRGKTEEVQVIEKAPTVSTTAANVRTVYDLDFVENLPIDGLATKVEPFVNNNTPGAGASGDRFRGGTNRQNQFMVEGFSMGNQRYTMKSLATIEAQTAAYGADNAATQGAVVNMVTKSGSNRFEFDMSGFYEDNRISPWRERADPTAPVTRFNLNPGFSGPIIKDKLWFYANVEARHEYLGFDRDPAGQAPQLPPQQGYFGRGSFKLTWQIAPRHKLSSFSLYNREAYSAQSDGNYDREQDTFYNIPRMSAFTSLTWEALLHESLFYRAQVGIQGNESQWIPNMCRSDPNCWHISPVENVVGRTLRLRNYEQVLYEQFKAFEVINTLEYFPKWSQKIGQHAFKFQSRYFVKNETNTLGVPGDKKTILASGRNDREIEYYANDPRLDGEARSGWFIRSATGTLLLHSLTDSMRLGRFVTLNAGIGLTNTISQTSAGKGGLNLHAFTPHASSIWDMTKDGKTVMRGSFAQYVDADAVRISRYALGDQVSRECRWNEETQRYDLACEYRGGASKSTFGLPCGPQGVTPDGRNCRTELNLPKMWEYTLGFEREVLTGLSLSSDLIYRRFTRPYEVMETNRIWNEAGSALSTLGGYRNGRAEQITDVETPAGAGRRYKGVTMAARQREGRMRAQIGYTWSRLDGNVDNGGDTNYYGDIPARDIYLWGPLQDDHRHDVRGAITYSLTEWLSFGTTLSFTSGAPYPQLFRNSVTGRYEDFRARNGMSTGANVNDPTDDRGQRLPDLTRVNLRLNANLRPLIGHNAEVSMDVLNALNTRTPTAVFTESGPTFGLPRTLQSRMLVRFGARYRY